MPPTPMLSFCFQLARDWFEYPLLTEGALRRVTFAAFVKYVAEHQKNARVLADVLKSEVKQ